MRLSFIGMSGSGKSFWSRILASHGFRRISCDELIAAELSKLDGTWKGSDSDLGKWMGFPYESRYRTRESIYLSLEAVIMLRIIEDFEHSLHHGSGDVVVDTTGSFIYAGRDLIQRLRLHTLFVHFAIPPVIREKMLSAYIANPRPLVWRDAFILMPGEGESESMKRCYPILLESRERLYETYADVTIDYYRARQADYLPANLLGDISGGLAAINGF